MNELRALLDGAADVAGVARRAVADGREYLVGDEPVVVLDVTGVAFRLRPDVAAAALRTPDVHVSPRGPEWVAFGPRSLDRFALDRATAWFALAVRLASRGIERAPTVAGRGPSGGGGQVSPVRAPAR